MVNLCRLGQFFSSALTQLPFPSKFFGYMDVYPRTRQAMERTLLVVVALEAFLGRFLLKGIELPGTARYAPGKPVPPPAWYVALDYLALFLLYFATVLGVLTLVVGRLEAHRRRGAPAPVRLGGYLGGACVVALVVTAVGGMVNAGGPAWIMTAAIGGVALYAIAAPWLAGHERVTAIGLGLVAAPVLLYAVLALFTDRIWTEEELWSGAARASFGHRLALATALAALAAPLVLAPRPLSRAMVQLVPFVAATAVSALGMFMLFANLPTTIAAIERTFGFSVGARDALSGLVLGPVRISWVHLGLFALSAMTWTIASCVVADSPARRRLGVGLGLVVAAGLGFAWPMNYVVVAAGLLAMVDAAPLVIAEERRGLSAVTPAIDDEAWLGFVSEVVARLRGAGGEVSAVSVRGDHGQISTVVITERHHVPVRLAITRVAGAVVSVDLVCGRESARVPAWTAVARGTHPAPPPLEPSFALDEPSFDRRFLCRGDRGAFTRAVDAELRAALARDVDGWLAGWDGDGVRHRVFPGCGAEIDQLLPLTALAEGRRPEVAAVDRVVARLELCARIAVGAGAAVEPTSESASESASEAVDP